MPIEEFIKIYLPLESEKHTREKEREKDLKIGKCSNVVNENKVVTCFGVQRRSASTSKLPTKHPMNNYN